MGRVIKKLNKIKEKISRINLDIIDVCEEMCDNYCKYPEMYKDDLHISDEQSDALEDICKKCPLNRL